MKEDKLPYSNFKVLLLMGGITFIVFSCNQSAKDILYVIYSDASYNFLSGLQFACNYLIGPISLLFIDHFLTYMRFGTVLFIGASSGNLFILGGLLIISCQTQNISSIVCSRSSIISSIVVSSLLSGILGTFWFVCHPAYINRMTTKKNKQLYFGLSSSIYYTAIILGNLYGDFYFFLMMVVLAISFNFLFLFLPQIKSKNTQLEKNHEPEKSFCSELIFQGNSIMNTLLNKQFTKIIWFFIVNGTYGSALYLFQSPMILNSLEDKTNEKQKVFAVFLTSSIGQASGGLLSSLLGKKMSLISVSYIFLIMKYISISMALISYLYKAYILTFPAGFFFGLVTTGSQTTAITILVNEISSFNHSFAAYNLTQCVGSAIPSLIWIFLNDQDFIYSVILMYVITTFGVISLTYYLNTSKNKQVQDGEQNVIINDLSQSLSS